MRFLYTILLVAVTLVAIPLIRATPAAGASVVETSILTQLELDPSTGELNFEWTLGLKGAGRGLTLGLSSDVYNPVSAASGGHLTWGETRPRTKAEASPQTLTLYWNEDHPALLGPFRPLQRSLHNVHTLGLVWAGRLGTTHVQTLYVVGVPHPVHHARDGSAANLLAVALHTPLGAWGNLETAALRWSPHDGGQPTTLLPLSLDITPLPNLRVTGGGSWMWHEGEPSQDAAAYARLATRLGPASLEITCSSATPTYGSPAAREQAIPKDQRRCTGEIGYRLNPDLQVQFGGTAYERLSRPGAYQAWSAVVTQAGGRGRNRKGVTGTLTRQWRLLTNLGERIVWVGSVEIESEGYQAGLKWIFPDGLVRGSAGTTLLAEALLPIADQTSLKLRYAIDKEIWRAELQHEGKTDTWRLVWKEQGVRRAIYLEWERQFGTTELSVQVGEWDGGQLSAKWDEASKVRLRLTQRW